MLGVISRSGHNPLYFHLYSLSLLYTDFKGTSLGWQCSKAEGTRIPYFLHVGGQAMGIGQAAWATSRVRSMASTEIQGKASPVLANEKTSG